MPSTSIRKQTGSAQLVVAVMMLFSIGPALYFGWMLKQETELASLGKSEVATLSRSLNRLAVLEPRFDAGSLDSANGALAAASTDINSFLNNVSPAVNAGISPLDRFKSYVEGERLSLQQVIKEMNNSLFKVRAFEDTKEGISQSLNDFVSANDAFLSALISLNNEPRKEIQSLSKAVRDIEISVLLSLATNGREGEVDKSWEVYTRLIRNINTKISTGVIAKKSTVTRGLSLAAQTANSLRSFFDTISEAREASLTMEQRGAELRELAGDLSDKANTYFKTSRGVFGYSVSLEIIAFLMIAAAILALGTIWMANQNAKGVTASMAHKAKTASEGSAHKSRSVQSIVDAIHLIKNGDLTVTLGEQDEFTREIAVAVNALVVKFRSIIGEVKVMSSELHAASAQSAQTASNVEESREQQDHAVSTAYQMTRELHGAIEAIEQSAKLTANSVEDSIRSVQVGSAAIEETNKTVKEISTVNQTIHNRLKSMMESVQGLNSVVDLIADVSTQTRMLSLNLPLLIKGVDEETAKRINFTASKMNEFVDSTAESLTRITTVVSSVVGEASEMQKNVEGSTSMATNLLAQSDRAKNAINSIESVAVKVEENSGLVEANSRKVASSSQEMVASMEIVKQYNQNNSQASKETAAAIGNVASNTVKIVKRVEEFKVHS